MWFSLANGLYNNRCRYEQLVEAASMARTYETLIGRTHHRSDGLYAMGLWLGPCPVGEALQRLDALDPFVGVDLYRAILLAMSDRIDEAWTLAGAAEQRVRELRDSADPEIGEIESLSGRHAAAAKRFALWQERQVGDGSSAAAGTYAALQARELCLAGRYEHAETLLEDCREGAFDPLISAVRLQAAALLASHRGNHDTAERLAQEALTHIHQTDSPKLQGDAFVDLAEVGEAAGRRQRAIEAWQEALDRYERKGVTPLARRVRERLAALEPA
jgi:tetratricopeptide (TPR) repeat protein